MKVEERTRLKSMQWVMSSAEGSPIDAEADMQSLSMELNEEPGKMIDTTWCGPIGTAQVCGC